MYFIDTNIWIYGTIVQEPVKRAIAQKIIRLALERDDFVISTQVMTECANALFKKGGKPAADVLGVIHWMSSLANVVPVTPSIVQRAVEIKALYGISLYDAQIISAAENAGCNVILSEDLSHSQKYCGLTCMNPFDRKDMKNPVAYIEKLRESRCHFTRAN